MSFTFTTQNKYNEVRKSRPALQAGWYEAVVLSAIEKRSSKGNPMIELNIGIEVGGPKLYERKTWLVLINSAVWKIEQFLAAIGKQFSKGEQVSLDAQSLPGKRLCITACLEEYTGADGNIHYSLDIMDFRRREDCPRLGAMTDEELSQWGLNLDGTRKTLTAAAREIADASTPQGMPFENDDDIPF